MKRLGLVWCIVAAWPAAASTSYLVVVQRHLALGAPPRQSCALCHTNGVTGVGTVNTPIGKALRARGLVSGNDGSLTAALDALAKDGVDSDGDGVPDVEELKAGTDPNVAGTDTGASPATPKYGCGAEVAPGLEALALGVWLVFSRRRRARPAR
jgi:hypothetical protein